MIERPSLHALEMFLAVVEHGTLTRAAEVLDIAQPSVSVQIKSLEGLFGVPLLERTGRRVRPTDIGLVVADYTRRILGLTDELEQRVAEHKGLQLGGLAVGTSATVAESWLPAVLGQFHHCYPSIELDLVVGNSSDVLQAVRERAIGVGIIGRITDDPEIAATSVYDDRLSIFVAVVHPLAQRNQVCVRDLADERFVVREKGSATRDLALQCLAQSNLYPSSILELSSNEAVKRSVAAGLGVGILSRATLELELQAGLITIIDCPDWSCARQFMLVRRADRVLTYPEQAFVQLLERNPAAAGEG